MQASNRFHTSAARTTWRRCPHSRSRRLQVSSSHPMACCDSLHVSHFWNRWRIERQLFFVAFFKQSFAWRYSRCRRCQAYRLPVEDPIFVVLSRRHSQDGQHRSWISSSCGEIILYQQDSLFFSATDFPSLEVGFTSDYLTWELDAVFSFKTLATDLTVPMRSEFELCAFNCHHQAVVCIRTQYNKTLIGSLRHWAPHWFWFRHHTFLLSCFFFLHQPLRRGLRVVSWTEMAAREDQKSHDVEWSEKMIPFFKSEIAFRQHACELVFGMNIFDLEFSGP